MLRVSLPLHGCVARRFYGIPPAKRAPSVVPRCAARQFRVPCANTPPLYFGVLILATFWHFADLAQQRSLTARLSSPGDSRSDASWTRREAQRVPRFPSRIA